MGYIPRPIPESREWGGEFASLLPFCKHEVIFDKASGGAWRDSRTGEFGQAVGGPSYVLEESGYSLQGASGKYQSFPWDLNQNNAWVHEVIVRMAPGWPTGDSDKFRPIVAVGDGSTADRALSTQRVIFGNPPFFAAMTWTSGGGSEWISSNITTPVGGEWYHIIYGTAGPPGPAQNARQIHIAVNGTYGNWRANSDTHGAVYSDPRVYINAGWAGGASNAFSTSGRHHVLLFRAWDTGFPDNDPDGNPLISALFQDPWFMYRDRKVQIVRPATAIRRPPRKKLQPSPNVQPIGPVVLNKASPQAKNLEFWMAWYPGNYREPVYESSIHKEETHTDTQTGYAASNEVILETGHWAAKVPGGSYELVWDNPNNRYDFGGDQLTISVWLKREVDFASSQWILAHENSAQTQGYGLVLSGSSALAVFQVPTTGPQLVSDLGLELDVTYHLVARYDGSEFRFFLDGIKQPDTQAASGDIVAVTQFPDRLNVGHWHFNSSIFFHGWLADVRVYSRALSDGEIWELYDPKTRWDLYALRKQPLQTRFVPPPIIDINLDPSTLSFGDTFAHNSSVLTAAIENVAPGKLIVSDVSLRGGTTPEFTVDFPATPFTIEGIGSVGVDVTYTPTDLGADSGFVDITSNDPNEPVVSIVISGTGVPVSAGPIVGTHDPDEIPEGVFADDAPIGTKVV